MKMKLFLFCFGMRLLFISNSVLAERVMFGFTGDVIPPDFPPNDSVPVERVMLGFSGGVGLYVGMGYFLPSVGIAPPLGAIFSLPTFELRIPLKNKQSLDLQLRVGDLIYGAILGTTIGDKGILLLPIRFGIYYNFRIGKNQDVLFAPGVEVDFLIQSSKNYFDFIFTIKPGVRFGTKFYESKHLSFEIRALIFLSFGFVTPIWYFEQSSFLIGLGCMGEIAFYFR